MSGAAERPAPMTLSELIEAAWDHYERGQLMSAARCLRAAADRLEERGREKTVAIETLIAASGLQ
ncbi:hypothetical protein [Erythrobacter sp. WG]|uniref:hypothetical protein n=1 Tax=Erythrobacter sp. WG TaxID=2985510 RepID=UPI0022712F60|nr:hypothetical protein [Erythrobacter sp. WG]MCX9146593.1 hypothetical protein [Erythrobacter sp. WG]